MKKHAWSRKQVKSAQVPNYSKLYVIKPALLKLLGPLEDRKVLELGCGNGFWLRLLKEKRALCTGVDTSRNQIEAAKKIDERISDDRIAYHVMDASNLTFKPASFDVVLLEKVLIEIPRLGIIRKIMKEAYRVLKQGGIILVSDLHPIAPNCNLPNVRTENGYRYFKSGVPIQIVSKRIDGGETVYTDYHWTFEDLIGAITDAGFKITEVKEPRPSNSVIKKYPYLRYRRDDPLSLMIKGIK